MKEQKEQRHITREMFDGWQQGTLGPGQEKAFLEHTAKCTFCAERFGSWMEENLMEPPAYLKEEIIQRTGQPAVQAAVKVKRTSKQMQLMMYSLRVGLAVVTSIFLLTVTASIQNMNLELPRQQERTEEQSRREEQREYESRKKKDGFLEKLNQGSNFVADTLNQMTNSLFQIEQESPEGQKEERK